jgi:hypothetical protein
VTTTASEIPAISHPARHCPERGCRKCAACARWDRRKRRRSHKRPPRRTTRKK